MIAPTTTDAQTAERRTVLVIEEDDAARESLADNLAFDRYRVRTADSREKGLAILSVDQPDVIIVDVNGKTLDLIDAIRSGDGFAGRVDADTPLIVLTGRVDELHRIRMLDRGGDDVLAKPYSYPELRARIAAVLRRAQARRAPRVLRIGRLTIDLSARIVEIDENRLELPAKEYELLRTLAREPSRVFTREELLRDVWGHAPCIRTRTVDSHASRLRRHLSDAGADALVRNIWGVGYRLADPVVRQMDIDSVGDGNTSADPIAAPHHDAVDRLWNDAVRSRRVE
jgi:DNA-binding response OmpR family regulator